MRETEEIEKLQLKDQLHRNATADQSTESMKPFYRLTKIPMHPQNKSEEMYSRQQKAHVTLLYINLHHCRNLEPHHILV